MNNHQIVNLLKSCPRTKGSFKGVYSADNVPETCSDLPATFVVNLSDSDEPGSHWTAVHIGLGELPEFFDSYGLPPALPRLDSLLGECYMHSNVQLQSILTTTCGQHVIYYILCKSFNKDMQTIINSYPGPPLENDIFVNKVIESVFAVDLDVIDTLFLRQHISHVN